MARRVANLLLVVAASASALALRGAPGRGVGAGARSMRVLVADVGNEVAWLPGDRRTLRSVSPSQAAALRAAATEALVSPGAPPPLVAMLPAVAAAPEPSESGAFLAPGGGGRRVFFTEGVDDAATRGDMRRAFADARATASGSRVAALCAVRRVRYGSDGDAVASATLEVVGRVAVRRLEVLDEGEACYWEDDRPAGGCALVATVGGHAVLEDAWVDELRASPVHAIHALRPLADDCARAHDAVRRRHVVDVALDRPLADAAAAARAAADECDLDVGRPLLDAYGDEVYAPPEIDDLRALSFAAWRALRPPAGPAAPADVLWAFGTRSTAARLERARDLLLARLDG